MSSVEFNLLSLPLLPINRVLFQMEEISFINFSLISKKTKLYSQMTAKHRRPFDFEADFNIFPPLLEYVSKFDGEIQIRQTDLSRSCHTLNIMKKSYKKTSIMLKDNPLFPHDCFEGLEEEIVKMAKHLIELFKIPIGFVSLYERGPSKLKMIMETLQPEGLHVDSTRDYSVKDLDILMKNAARCKRVQIFFNGNCAPSTVDFSNSNFDAFEAFEAFEAFGKWLKLEHVLAAKFKRFNVFNSSLTSTDVNTFIKQWKSGWNPDMRQFGTVNFSQYDEPVVLKGLNAEFNRNPRMFRAQNFSDLRSDGQYTFFTSSFLSEIPNGWEIQREYDGFLARIVLTHRWVRMYVWSPEELRHSLPKNMS